MTKILVTFYLPTKTNHKKPLTKELREFRKLIIHKFNGLSISNNLGYWLDKRIYRDNNKAYSVLMTNNKTNRLFIKQQQAKLKKQLKQKSIFITIQNISKVYF